MQKGANPNSVDACSLSSALRFACQKLPITLAEAFRDCGAAHDVHLAEHDAGRDVHPGGRSALLGGRLDAPDEQGVGADAVVDERPASRRVAAGGLTGEQHGVAA